MAALAVAMLAYAPASGLQRCDSVEPHMGTLVRVTVYAPDEHAARDAFRAAFDRIRELEAIFGLRLIESRTDAAALIVQRTDGATAVRPSTRFLAFAAPTLTRN